ncbi:MAG TPA: threonine synthase [Rhizomicrobium sp.]
MSTRGQAPRASFTDILLAGLAPDGGLYLPQAWPPVPAAEQAGFAGKPYADVAFAILRRFVGSDVGDADLKADIAAAYATFDGPEIAPLRGLGPRTFLLELFHGPTLAFKDIALQILGRLFSRALARRGGKATVVAATSGDTGSAAIAALGGLANIEVFVLHPKGRVSEVQRRQMTTSGHANVHNIALEGTFDDCQGIVKALFADRDFAPAVSLTAVNSINFARIAAQSVYYFTATAALAMPCVFVVPTGNFGDVFAGEAAMRLGLPVEKLIVATNENDIMARVLTEGVYKPGPVHASLSPSMDIQVASNFERALFEASGRDAEWLRDAMATLAAEGALTLPAAILADLRRRYEAQRTTDAQTLETIAEVYRQFGFAIDPHTAVAAHGQLNAVHRGRTVILSTAHPAKFPDAVARASGMPPPLPERLKGLLNRPERLDILPNDKALVRAHIESKLSR